MIRIGCCCDGFSAGILRQSGFDYAELSLSSLYSMPEEEYIRLRTSLEISGLQAECFNCIFSGQPIRMVGIDADQSQLMEYASKSMERAADLGGKLVVLGSGAARRVEEGFSLPKAHQQLREAILLLADQAGELGMDLVLEPLTTSETNLLNTVEEGIALCEELNHPHVALLADLYHMQQNGEDLGILVRAGSWLRHVHYCNPEGRCFPTIHDSFDDTPFWNALQTAGYRGRVSVEAISGDLRRDAPNAMLKMNVIKEMLA